ncbi:TetR/AcrR family transcriptional regulator [Mucilaginibacter sp.]|uniref:TetR/AcrR family transcriptional regulator n=1 Tax=Mucilaginibacter sp. TaxID=1882438 RepID=UPI002615F0F7|nr:TetR/AcrR family transcriptional regulator [Mucilaginibacter sp.]MDB4926746.1 hypothetical protein [Mucilaginibacter sp.]
MKKSLSATDNIILDGRAKLLYEAEQLFAEFGYELTSTRLIAARSGLNLSLINYYFGSKMGLYEEIFKIQLQEINSTLQAIFASSTPASEKLNTFLNRYIDLYSLNSSFLRLLFNEYLIHSKPIIIELIDGYHDENMRILGEIMEEGTKSDNFKMINASLFYFTIMGVLSANQYMLVKCDTDHIKKYLFQIIRSERTSLSNHT